MSESFCHTVSMQDGLITAVQKKKKKNTHQHTQENSGDFDNMK